MKQFPFVVNVYVGVVCGIDTSVRNKTKSNLIDELSQHVGHAIAGWDPHLFTM